MIATRTMVMLSAVALALLAGCAGETQEDPMLADKIAKADEVFKSRQYEEAGVLFEEIAGEAGPRATTRRSWKPRPCGREAT